MLDFASFQAQEVHIMKTISTISIVVAVSALCLTAAYPDILVLNNGQVFLGDVSTTPSGRYKLSTEYGDQFFAKEQVANFWLTREGMEAESYYQAGVLLLSKGHRNTALQLFQRCVKQDATYRDKCNAALSGAASPVAPTGTTPAETAAGTPGAATPTVSPPQPQVQYVRIACGECSGTGVVMAGSRVGTGTDRPRPCPMCGGKGYKDLRIPAGYEICPDCNGLGASMSQGGGGSSRRSSGSSRRSSGSSRRSSGSSRRSGGGGSGFTLKKEMCPRCAGRGVVKAAWKPPEEMPGTEGSEAVMMTTSPSPTPGAEPPRGSANIIRERAQDVAEGNQPSRPIGPSGVRPVSPTLLEDPSSGDFESGGGDSSEEVIEEEVIEEDSGSSSDAATEEGSEEVKNQEPYYGDDDQGLIGKLNKYKWYVVLGGCVLLVFAMVFKKMSAKR